MIEEQISKAKFLSQIRKKRAKQIIPSSYEIPNNVKNADFYYESILYSDDSELIDRYKNEMADELKHFKKLTKLKTIDFVFLTTAIGLNILSQYLDTFKPKIKSENATKKRDKSILDNFNDKFNRDGETSKQGGYYYAKLEDILGSTSVPYDYIKGGKKHKLNIGGINHRYKTLGHDPVLGYYFGTINILTNTLTTTDFSSYHIRNSSIFSKADTKKVISSSTDRMKTDKIALAAALLKQHLHIKSDKNTVNGVPIPFTFDYAKELADYGLRFDNIQARFIQSRMIDFIIAITHYLVVRKKEEVDKRILKVRTTKVLLISSIIAESSNVLYVAVSSYCNTKTGNVKGVKNAISKLDIGGLCNLIYRLHHDPELIKNIKYEFLNSELSKIYEERYAEIEKYYS